METVSIIIPIYNAERYLVACLDSVLKQTYHYLDIILVDDGSSDASCDICDNYGRKDPRITVYHRENAGVSASRNFGLEHAKGKYVLFVDADDTMEPDMIRGCIQLADSYKAELIVCSFRYHLMNGSQIVENSLGSDFFGTELELFDHWYVALVKKNILNPPWNKFVRKDLLDTNQIRFPEKYSICEDMAFSVKVLAASKKTVLSRHMYYNYYKKSSGSLASMFHENYAEALNYFYESAYEYCNRFANNSKQLKILYTQYVNLTFMFLNQICTRCQWDRKARYKEINKIRSNERFLLALNSTSLNSRKKLIIFLLKSGQFYLLHILYRL